MEGGRRGIGFDIRNNGFVIDARGLNGLCIFNVFQAYKAFISSRHIEDSSL